MIQQETLLVALVKLVDCIPSPPQPAKKRAPGRSRYYTDRLFLKALIIMIVRHLYKVSELLTVLEQPSPEMQTLRSLLAQDGHFPTRRTWDRRMAALPSTLPAQIGCFGRHLVALIVPWATCGRAVAIDSTVLRALGGMWHKKDREKGIVPHTRIDTQAGWTKSGWHGWVYGWKLHLICTVAWVWIPLAADLTAANVADEQQATLLLPELPTMPLFVLGDRHYNADPVREACRNGGHTLVASRWGTYPHQGPGRAVRSVFHKLRSVTIENFNELFKGIFSAHEQVPTKGLVATQRFGLGAIFLYQVALLYRFEHHMDLRVGLKAFLHAA